MNQTTKRANATEGPDAAAVSAEVAHVDIREAPAKTDATEAVAIPADMPTDTEPDTSDLHVGICPYYIRDRGKGLVYCECARFRFPDIQSRREIVYRYCAHPSGYKDCMLKRSLDHYYERKYQDHD